MKVLLAAALAVLAAAGAAAQEKPQMTIEEAIAKLAGERTRAENCVLDLKNWAAENDEAIQDGRRAYTAAKANVDEVITGLIASLAVKQDPEALPDVGATLARGVLAREAFCAEVATLAPDQGEGETRKGLLGAALGAAIGPLIEAVATVYIEERKLEEAGDQVAVKTLQTQLEGTKWSDFKDIKP